MSEFFSTAVQSASLACHFTISLARVVWKAHGSYLEPSCLVPPFSTGSSVFCRLRDAFSFGHQCPRPGTEPPRAPLMRSDEHRKMTSGTESEQNATVCSRGARQRPKLCYPAALHWKWGLSPFQAFGSTRKEMQSPLSLCAQPRRASLAHSYIGACWMAVGPSTEQCSLPPGPSTAASFSPSAGCVPLYLLVVMLMRGRVDRHSRWATFCGFAIMGYETPY